MIPYSTNALNVLNADIKGTYIKYSLVPESIEVFIKKYTSFISICTNKKDVPVIKYFFQ